MLAEKSQDTFFCISFSRGFQFLRLSARIWSISSIDLRSPAIPMMFSFLSITSISIRSPSSTSAIGPPSTASGLQCPITGPVDAPEKTSVCDQGNALSKFLITADCLRSIEHFRHSASLWSLVTDEYCITFLNLMLQNCIQTLLFTVERSCAENRFKHFLRACSVFDHGTFRSKVSTKDCNASICSDCFVIWTDDVFLRNIYICNVLLNS